MTYPPAAPMPSLSQQAPVRARRGFTLVEILVAVAIIAVLMGLLIGGLRGAAGTARKTRELNGLRGVFAAWYQYANSYDENLLPGFIDSQTQANWQVKYSNLTGRDLNPDLAQPYPWRLARFLDNPFTTLNSYLELEASDPSADSAPSVAWEGGPPPPTWAESSFGTEGSMMALQPAFAYNAYYVGGWYEAAAGAAPRFANAGWTSASGAARSGALVATRLAGITRTAETVIFTGGTYRDVGIYKASLNPEDRVPGAAWIVPPFLGTTAIWEPALGRQEGMGVSGASMAPSFAPQAGMSDTGSLQVFVRQGVPARRHTGLVATVRADGSTESSNIGALMDMRLWIDGADRGDFTHFDN